MKPILSFKTPFHLSSRLPRPFSKGNVAFTLLELLAVIAIIAILAALIYPFANNALTAARQARCAGNLRAIGQLLATYSADNDGKTVPPATSGSWNWSEIIGQAPKPDVYLGYLVPARSIWRCPENKLQILDYVSNWGGELGGSYTINGMLYPDQGASYTFENRYADNRVANFTHPSQLYAVFEGTYCRSQVGGGGLGPVRWPHGNSMNILFADGHVESLKKPADGLLPGYGAYRGATWPDGNNKAANYVNGLHWLAN